LTLTVVKKASGTITGPEQPTAGTITEGVGVLGYVAGCASAGWGVGQSIGDVPGGVAGAVIGGGAAIGTMRIKPVREQAFKFVRWLENRD
jgi:hypothetical protein